MPRLRLGVVAVVLHVDELAEDLVAVLLLAHVEEDDASSRTPPGSRGRRCRRRRRRPRRRVAETGARGGGEAEPVDVVVARAVLLDVDVGLGDVGLGLVVVVVGDEVLDRVRGEELLELVAELRGERLVVADHERRAADLLDDPGHRRGLARSRRAEQRLVALACVEVPLESGSIADGWSPVGLEARLGPQLGHRRPGYRGSVPRRHPGCAAVASLGQSPQSKSRERDQRPSSETGVGGLLLDGCRRGSSGSSASTHRPLQRGRLVDDRLGAVERVLDPRLLLGLEKRMVLERIIRHVPLERHLVLERGVAPP